MAHIAEPTSFLVSKSICGSLALLDRQPAEDGFASGRISTMISQSPRRWKLGNSASRVQDQCSREKAAKSTLCCFNRK
jgi:hypothetical protein